MDDLCLYHILVRGLAVESEVAHFCPPGFRLEPRDESNTLLCARTDQAGMIGLIRNLHGLGFTLLSISCAAAQEENQPSEERVS